MKFDPISIYNRAKAARMTGDLMQAYTILSQLCDFCPTDILWRTEFGYSCMDIERHSEAIDNFRIALSLDENSKAAWGGLGLALMELDNFNDAISAFKKRLSLCESANHRVFLANCYRILGDFSESAQQCRQAIAIDSNHEEAYFNLGVALKNLGQIAEAKSAFRKAIELDCNYKVAMRELASLEL